jgi:hypothetical protein
VGFADRSSTETANEGEMAMNGEPLEKDDIAALAVQLDDARAELIEEHKKGREAARKDFDTLWTFLNNPPENPAVPLLEEVIVLLRPPAVRWPWWHRWYWPAAVLAAGIMGCGVGWWLWGASAYVQTWARLGQRMDTVMVEQYLGLSAQAQQAINGLYRQLGLTSPGERKGKRS